MNPKDEMLKLKESGIKMGKAKIINLFKKRDKKRTEKIRKIRDKFIRHAESLDWREKEEP